MPSESCFEVLNTIVKSLEGVTRKVTDTPALDAQVLLAHILEKPRAWVLAHPESVLSPKQQSALEVSLRRLVAGEPLPYILGHWEFFGLDFLVSQAALIPRPETELLVEQAMKWLHERRSPPYASDTLWAADIGTGSGCIAVTLAVLMPGMRVLASDFSLPALRLTRANASRHAVSAQVHLVQADLIPAGRIKFDLICANLPYVPSAELRTLQVADYEPLLALNGGADGLSLVRRLLDSAASRLAPGGLLLVEIDFRQGEAVRSLAQVSFPEAKIQVLPDLAGRDRLASITQPEV